MRVEKNKGLLSNILNEYKKVTWANKSTVFQVTVIVLLITAFIAILVTVFDISLSYVLNNISNLLKRVI